MCNNKVRKYDDLLNNIGFDISDRASTHGIRVGGDRERPPSFMVHVLAGNEAVSQSVWKAEIFISWHASLLNKEDALFIYNALLNTEFSPHLRPID